MSIEQDLQEFILTKYKSVSQFANAAGVAYTTIKGGLERGIMGMSVQNVIKICNALSIDVDKLADGKIEQAKKNTTLDVDEFNLINQYRAVDNFGKQLIIDVAKHEYNRCTENLTTIKIAARDGQSEELTLTDSEKQKLLDEINSLPDVDDLK